MNKTASIPCAASDRMQIPRARSSILNLFTEVRINLGYIQCSKQRFNWMPCTRDDCLQVHNNYTTFNYRSNKSNMKNYSIPHYHHLVCLYKTHRLSQGIFITKWTTVTSWKQKLVFTCYKQATGDSVSCNFMIFPPITESRHEQTYL